MSERGRASPETPTTRNPAVLVEQLPLEIQMPDGSPNIDGRTVLSYGLGADSTLILCQMLKSPASFGLRPDLSDLIVVTAMTGNEWHSTINEVEHLMLPRLRAAGVRYVQVSRNGPYEKDGWSVLDDSQTPQRVHVRGRWTLLNELQSNGTVVQAAGGHACSQKYKGWVLDSWARREFGRSSFRKIIGYNAEEVGRMVKSEFYQARNNEKAGHVICTIEYPLIEQGYDRERIERDLIQEFGSPWAKSYCFFCPYSGVSSSQPVHLARLRAHPDQALKALTIEYVSMALNRNGSIYPRETLYKRLADDGSNTLLVALEEHLNSVEWCLYRVRRILPAGRTSACRQLHGETCRSPWPGCIGPSGARTRACQRQHGPVCRSPQLPCRDSGTKGQALRSLEVLSRGGRSEMATALAKITHRAGEHVEKDDAHPLGHERGYRLSKRSHYPTVEEFFCAAPAGARPKKKESFEKIWADSLLDLRR